MIAKKTIGKIVSAAIIMYLLIVGLVLVLGYDSNISLADNILRVNIAMVAACAITAVISLIVGVLIFWILDDNH